MGNVSGSSLVDLFLVGEEGGMGFLLQLSEGPRIFPSLSGGELKRTRTSLYSAVLQGLHEVKLK